MEKLVKKQPISQLKVGDAVDDIFVVKMKRSILPYKNGSAFSFTLILSDSSGASLEYKYWGGSDESKVKAVLDGIKQDDILHVKGAISSYQGKLQIGCNETGFLKVLGPEEYEANFIMESKKDVELMVGDLMGKIESVKEPLLNKLLNNIFDEIIDSFKNHPGAIQIHHAWIGGLLQHTLEVASHCENCTKIHPELDRDLLITAALLHDIGKLQEITMTTRIKGTQKGQLIGHITLGINFLNDKLKNSELSEVIQDKIIHLIASHQGKLEYGSPKEPAVPEAFALYYADELSAKLSPIIEFVKERKENEEEDFTFHPRERRNIFLK